MSYCFIYNSPDDFANSNRLESRVFFPRIWVCWIKAFQGSRLDLILHITSLQHWPGPYICRWNSDKNCCMWVFFSNHRHPYLKVLTHLLYAERYSNDFNIYAFIIYLMYGLWYIIEWKRFLSLALTWVFFL